MRSITLYLWLSKAKVIRCWRYKGYAQHNLISMLSRAKIITGGLPRPALAPFLEGSKISRYVKNFLNPHNLISTLSKAKTSSFTQIKNVLQNAGREAGSRARLVARNSLVVVSHVVAILTTNVRAFKKPLRTNDVTLT